MIIFRFDFIFIWLSKMLYNAFRRARVKIGRRVWLKSERGCSKRWPAKSSIG